MIDAIPATIGVIGAGTMGVGIAQLAAQTGARVLLHDPLPDALTRGLEAIDAALQRQQANGRIEPSEAAAIRARVEPAGELSALAPCGLVIEAAPERLQLKLDLFAALAEVVGPGCVLATNTSSLSVTEIAAGTPQPERVVGMHFFNPAPVMRLLEVIAGAASSAQALATARAVGEAMGKRVIDAADIAGFLVNRCNRPYSLEALRLLQERIATVEQIDRIARLGGGFRMGPFELMDLIGIETNHAVAEAFYRQTFGEPRYRPSPLAARMIAAGTLGRKTGSGWYDYTRETEYRPPDPEPRTAGGADGRLLVIGGTLQIAASLLEAARDAGWDARTPAQAGAAEPWLTVDCGAGDRVTRSPAGPRAVLMHAASLHASEPSAVGFHVLPSLSSCRLVELTTTPVTLPEARERFELLAASLGAETEHVGDAPGLVLGRIVCQLINEAAFLIGEGNGTPADVDAGMELGVNHPRGPLAWAGEIGLEHVISVLDALHAELGEERYRVAPLLRRRHALGAGLG